MTTGKWNARPAAPGGPTSPLATGAPARVAAVAAVLVGLWLAIAWAMAGGAG